MLHLTNLCKFTDAISGYSQHLYNMVWLISKRTCDVAGSPVSLTSNSLWFDFMLRVNNRRYFSHFDLKLQVCIFAVGWKSPRKWSWYPFLASYGEATTTRQWHLERCAWRHGWPCVASPDFQDSPQDLEAGKGMRLPYRASGYHTRHGMKNWWVPFRKFEWDN